MIGLIGWMTMAAMLLIPWVPVGAADAAEPTSRLSLLAEPQAWEPHVDSGNTTMERVASTDAPLAVQTQTDGGDESFPKIQRQWEKPQDWRRFAHLRLRLRVTATDPLVTGKSLNFVFSDDRTRLENLPGTPPKQQGLGLWVPAGEWLETSLDLSPLGRSAILGLQIYVYENPPAVPHTFRVEIARLELEGIDPRTTVFDGQAYGRRPLPARQGRPAARVATTDGLALLLGSAGEVRRVSFDGREVGRGARGPSGILVRDATSTEPPVMAGGHLTQSGGEARQSARLDSLGLQVEATYRSLGNALEIAGSVADLRGSDRAVTVAFALPVAAKPWRWWESISAARVPSQEMAQVPFLEVAHTRYPLSALSLPGTAGLSLAIRMDEPATYRLAYNPKQRLYYVAFDFGPVPGETVEGRALSAASFRVVLYRHDPAWGFRSALRRYYDLFPDFFLKRARQDGGWGVWRSAELPDPAYLEAGFAYSWGPSESVYGWNSEHGILNLLYIEPEYYQMSLGDMASASNERALERLRKLAAGDDAEWALFENLHYTRAHSVHSWPSARERTGLSLREFFQRLSLAAERSAFHDATGQVNASVASRPGWIGDSTLGAMFACNLDPDIPEGKGWFNTHLSLRPMLEDLQARTGGRVDGLALDCFLFLGPNFRRDHFRYANHPLTFVRTPNGLQPALLGICGSLEWLRDLRRQPFWGDRLFMANLGDGSSGFSTLTFGAPHLDIFGVEHGWVPDPDFLRAMAYRKPITDLPYSPRAPWVVGYYLLHCIFPGEGHDREMMRRYVPLLRELSAAGWEPVTGARADSPQVRLERYGSGSRVYLVAHNKAEQPVRTRIALDAATLRLPSASAFLLPDGKAVPFDGRTLTLRLEAKQTVVVRLARTGANRERSQSTPMPELAVWTAHSTETILTTQESGAGTAVVLAAARGEQESAQIVLRSTVDLEGVRAAVSPLVGPRGARLEGECLSLRRVGYLDGRPDVLAPLRPLALQAGKAQPLWLTVTVPRQARPGRYQGEITVSVPGHGTAARVPVSLTVWRFTLPERPSLPAVFGIADPMFVQRYGLKEGTPEWQQALHAWYQLLIRYRLSPYFCRFQQPEPNHYSYPAPWPIGDPRTDALLADPRLAAFAIPYPLGGDREQLRRTLEHLRAKRLLDRGYFYLWDEPGLTEQYAKIHAWAKEIQTIAPEARILTTYYCGPQDGPRKGELDAVPELLRGATQIFCMSAWATAGKEDYGARLRETLRPGEEWWLYVCCGPGEPHPNLFLSMSGVQHRAVMWRVWKEGATGFLYWAVNAYASNARPDDPITFIEGLPAGDGVLVYPGEAFGETGPLASIRLERWRDGMEDLEYLRALEHRFGRDEAQALLHRVYQGPPAYTSDPQAIEDWRRAMAERLDG